MGNSNYIIVIAIDIGETQSGFLHSTIHEPNRFLSVHLWKGSTSASYKVPTIALFNEKKEFHSFGFEAQNYYADLRNEEEKTKWFYFQGFGRMTLDCTLDSTLSDVRGKKMDSYIVYGSAIQFFKDVMVETIRKRLHNAAIRLSDLHFAMIVPSVFKRSLQTVLQKAFLYAGVEDGKYSFVRESEAVFTYWKYIMPSKPACPDLADGNCFLIVNLKGRTASITAQKAPGGIIRRLHSISGGGWGGQAVNEEFKQLLIKLVGTPVFLQFVEEYSDDWADIECIFERIKRSLQLENDCKIAFNLPYALRMIYGEYFNESIQDAVNASPFAGKITILADKMRINASVMKGLFKNALEKIISNINNTLTSDAVKDEKTETIFLVGGFSESLIVQDAVRKAFSNYNVICLEDPTSVIGKGAVLQGHHTATVKRRQSAISNSTYGIHFCQVSNEDGRSAVERSVTKILVRKGDKIYEGEKVTWKLHAELCDEEHIEMQFFVSPKTETVEMDEDDVERMKMVRIKADGIYTKDIEASIVFENDEILGKISGIPVRFNKIK